MRTRTTTAMVVAALTLGLLASAPAEPRRGAPLLFDPRTVETVTGEVVAVERVTRERRPHPGVRVTLETARGAVTVRLGPAWYLDRHQLTPAKGDRLTVKGSRVTVDGVPTIVAAEVTGGGRTVELRDPRGLPRWGRRGARP